MVDVRKTAEDADVIIRGYAVQRCDEGIRVSNLNNEKSVAVLKADGTLIETNMDDIDLAIARKHMFNALKYMEG